MTHPRQTIRKTVKDILIKGNTDAKKNVFNNSMIHPKDDCLPYIIIYDDSETIELLDQAPKRQKRTMSMRLEVMVTATKEETVSDNLDQLMWQIENVLGDDDDWNQTVSKHDLISAAKEFRESGTRPIGVALMTYEVEYITTVPASVLTQEAANATDLDAVQGYAGLNNDEFGWDIGHHNDDPDGTIDAEILIET